MNLKNRALMIATGIGVVLQVLQAMLVNGTLIGGQMANDASLLVTLVLVSRVLCACCWLLTLGTGFAYAYFAAQEGPITVADGAIGGAIATAIAGLIGGLLSGCLFLVAPLITSGGSAGASLIGAQIGAAVGAICGGPIGGAIIGAISGAIGAATVGKPKTA